MGLIKKNPLGQGIFVRWDSTKQNKIYIGDRVKITTPRQTLSIEEEEIGLVNTDIESYVMTGTLILRLSKGLMLRVGDKSPYVYYKISYSPYCSKIKHTWELL